MQNGPLEVLQSNELRWPICEISIPDQSSPKHLICALACIWINLIHSKENVAKYPKTALKAFKKPFTNHPNGAETKAKSFKDISSDSEWILIGGVGNVFRRIDSSNGSKVWSMDTVVQNRWIVRNPRWKAWCFSHAGVLDQA